MAQSQIKVEDDVTSEEFEHQQHSTAKPRSFHEQMARLRVARLASYYEGTTDHPGSKAKRSHRDIVARRKQERRNRKANQK